MLNLRYLDYGTIVAGMGLGKRKKVQQDYMLLHAADPGMVHTGSSSVTNAKQTKGINARNQNIAAPPLMKNPSQQMKRKKIS